MASITEPGVGVSRWLLGALVLLGCSEKVDPKRPQETEETEETGTPTETDTTLPEETGTLPTGDTGTVETGPVYPPCDHVPVTDIVYMTGDERWDFAGRWIDVGDIDGDGCDEVVVSASWEQGLYTDNQAHSAAHLLQEPWLSGVLPAVDYATFKGTSNNGLGDNWGVGVGLLPTVGQLAHGGQFGGSGRPVHIEDLPVDTVERIPAESSVGSIFTGTLYGPWAIMAGSQASACTSSVGPALCVTSVDTVTDAFGNNAGQVLVYDVPITTEIDVLSYRAALQGDIYDSARIVDGREDIDGDGITDIVVGAFDFDVSRGRVALVFDVQDGTQRLWDVASATLSGETVSGNFGFQVTSGDLDGDGYADLWADELGTGTVYVFRGPFSGDRSTSQADWTVLDDETTGWLGYDGAIRDLDGDGAAELVVGSPWSVYDPAALPGSVLVYAAPTAGTYLPADATRTLTSGVGEADSFGLAISAGDLDGDGLGDLVIGAPRDPTPGELGGSVTLVFGAALNL